MKKYLYKIIPLILIFVFVFSVPVFATDSSESGIYCSSWNDEDMMLIYNAEVSYLQRGTFCTKDISSTNYINNGNRLCFYIKEHSSYYSGYNLVLFNGTLTGQYYYYYNGSIADSSSAKSILEVRPYIYAAMNSIISEYKTISFETNIPIFASELEAQQFCSGVIGVESAINYMKTYDVETESWVSVAVPDVPKNDLDFSFDIFDDFHDFAEQSSQYNDISQKQTVTENANSPNDSVFLNVFQSISGLIHTGNSIMQQISSQIQNFTRQFYENFSQYALNLMNNILDSINNLLPSGFTDIVNELYQSGLDENGNFSIGTSLNYFFVPSDDFIQGEWNRLESSLIFVTNIKQIGNIVHDVFVNTSAETPVIVLPAGTYGFINITEDYEIRFDWFLAWKPYTDAFIAAFLYIGIALHLYKTLPSIINGTGAVTTSTSTLDSGKKGGK